LRCVFFGFIAVLDIKHVLSFALAQAKTKS